MSTPETFTVTNPATGEQVGTYPVHTAADVEERVEQARLAQGWWADLGWVERKRRLNRWIADLGQRSDEICELAFREVGRPRGDGQFELIAGLEDVRWAAAHAEKVLGGKRVPPGLALFNFDAHVSYPPLGVVGVIVPWNVPVYTALCGLAYALAAGNAAVVKASEIAPGGTVLVIEAFYRANPDAPAGLVSWITGFGDTGNALCRSGVDKLAFTGSVPTGRKVMQACAENLTPVLLELGGNDVLIVAEDADIEAAADAIVWGGVFNGGQACVGIERVYVVESVREALLAKVKAKAAQITVGLGDTDSYGPMIVPSQIETVRKHVDAALAAGATALVGGPASVREPFVDPIVLVDVPEDCVTLTEETFGPLVVINSVPDTDEAVRRANSTPFGLGSSVFSADRGREIAAQIRAGGTVINACLTFVGMPSVPFGGVGHSGFGRFHGEDGLREFTSPKATLAKRFQLGPDMQSFPRKPEYFEQVRRMVKMRYARRRGV
ncbi:aldehyde dehydrogenase family protein [Nocardioides acrostichi]|uniref:Aldehyde dehydrogenase n=1 Tax=Nocardioides acrostichi TaxID=2784339 RepID=A0A930YBV1_9ACTN|nr:aldehyde dehydrogenase family protein [Nocardioides acrostichi]MBF4160839.1 aldehyde dehydrogenase family protein [Nocardioides acrostichi]